ncbi:MAG: hypothetical protein PHY73_00670 [Candidatus Omnitrophica bacterium]|nr:hypothetical protein [Candidatus Omnitrophota bacterium]
MGKKDFGGYKKLNNKKIKLEENSKSKRLLLEWFPRKNKKI